MISSGEPIAIIGLSCRFPGANSPEELSGIIESNRDCSHDQVPTSRSFHEKLSEQMPNGGGFLSASVDEFDPEFFNLSPNKSVFLDPQQRILLELTWNALEEANINPHRLKGSKTNVYVGVSSIDYEKVLYAAGLAQSCEFHIGIMSNTFGAISARLAYFLGLHGRHFGMDAGGVSSHFCLFKACKNLRRNECNLAIVTGTNLILFPMIGSDICKKQRSEGCAVVLLKRLSDAVRDGDEIHGVINTIGVNCEPTTSYPSVESQSKLIQDCLNVSSYNPSDISWMEIGRSSTGEREAVQLAYGKEFNSIGSVQDIVGNTEATSGLAALMRIILMMKKHRGNTIVAGVHGVGLGGRACHFIVEQPPSPELVTSRTEHCHPEKSHEVVTISAQNPTALSDLVTLYADFLKENSRLTLEELAFLTQSCRAQLSHRASVFGHSVEEVRQKLLDKRYFSGKMTPGTKIAFLYTGAPNHKKRIVFPQALYETQIIFKTELDRCNKFILNNWDWSVLEFLRGTANLEMDDLESLEYKQRNLIAHFCIQHCLTKLWTGFGIHANFVFGFGMGEFGAATGAGMLSLETVLKIIFKYSVQVIRSGHNEQFLTVRAKKTVIPQIIDYVNNLGKENGAGTSFQDTTVSISSYMSPDQTIVSGPSSTMKELRTVCEEEGIPVSQAGTHLHPILSEDTIQTQVLNNVNVEEIKTDESPTYISGVTGHALQSSSNIITWANFMTCPVNVCQAINTLCKEGVRVFIEMSSGDSTLCANILSCNVSDNSNSNMLAVSSLRHGEDSLVTLQNSVAKVWAVGIDVEWNTQENIILKKQRMQQNGRTQTIPGYTFQKRSFWPQNVNSS